MTNTYQFMLTFRLPTSDADPVSCLDALYDAGCDDASVGLGQRGLVGLDFLRSAAKAEDALKSAIEAVQQAIPGADLVEAGPDLVNLTAMAEIFGCSKQNMQKYASSRDRRFPEPVFTGQPSLWHLAEIAAWLSCNTGLRPSDEVIEVSKAAAEINLKVQTERVRRLQAA